MIVVSKPEPTRRSRLRDLLDWLERCPRAQVRIRPYCSQHLDTLMVTRKTADGVSHFYCPQCQNSWKGNPVREV